MPRPGFGSRSSGFTRIVHLGKRLGDSTEEVLFQLVDEKVIVEVVKPAKVKTADVKTVKKSVKKIIYEYTSNKSI